MRKISNEICAPAQMRDPSNRRERVVLIFLESSKPGTPIARHSRVNFADQAGLRSQKGFEARKRADDRALAFYTFPVPHSAGDIKSWLFSSRPRVHLPEY